MPVGEWRETCILNWRIVMKGVYVAGPWMIVRSGKNRQGRSWVGRYGDREVGRWSRLEGARDGMEEMVLFGFAKGFPFVTFGVDE